MPTIHIFDDSLQKVLNTISSFKPKSQIMSLSFKGHTVVVTGAGGGLGKA
jgi:FlaA1/EpsC-like NDP-sugar epimerase